MNIDAIYSKELTEHSALNKVLLNAFFFINSWMSRKSRFVKDYSVHKQYFYYSSRFLF